MIEEFSTALLSYTNSSVLDTSEEKRMKPVQENWNKPNNKRNSGRYTQAPDEPTIAGLMSSLLVPTNNVNDKLILPTVTPNWINTAIGLLLSTQTYGTYYSPPPILPSNIPIILDLIRSCLDEWSTSTAQNNKFLTTDFNVPLADEFKELDNQSMYILEQILIPLLDCKIICYRIYVCPSCKREVKIRSILTCIPVTINNTGLHIQHDLLAFFGSMVSDLLCSVCGKSTVRHIEVVKWPQVLIINVIRSTANFQDRKPPPIIYLSQFSNWLAIGTPSSCLYDLITFNSVVRAGDKANMIRVTKSKKSWMTSVNKRKIGNGPQLRRLFGNGRILVFERVFHQKKFDMIRAIARCAMDSTSYELPDTPICITLQEACSIIETNHDLNSLQNILISEIQTDFYCYLCNKVLDSFTSSNDQIYIFKISSKNQIIAHPVICKNNEDNDNGEKSCPHCQYSIKNVDLPIYKQVYHKCPVILLKFVDNDVPLNDIFNSQIKLTDSTGEQFSYTTTAILITSRFSNTISVVKKQTDQYITYSDHLYTDTVVLTVSKLLDLLNTSMSIIAFYSRNRTVQSQSSIRIISQDLVNGVRQLTVRSGDQFYLVTCGEANTTNER